MHSVVAEPRPTLVTAVPSRRDVEELEFSDPSVINAIVARATAGVTGRVVLETPVDDASDVSKIKTAGGTVVGYSDLTRATTPL